MLLLLLLLSQRIHRKSKAIHRMERQTRANIFRQRVHLQSHTEMATASTERWTTQWVPRWTLHQVAIQHKPRAMVGGQFDRLIGLFKGTFYKSIRNGTLWWTELEEVIMDIKIALNRPLSYLEDDVQLPVLTPQLNAAHQPKLPAWAESSPSARDGSTKASQVPWQVQTSNVELLDPWIRKKSPGTTLASRRRANPQPRRWGRRNHQGWVEEPKPVEVSNCGRAHQRER